MKLTKYSESDLGVLALSRVSYALFIFVFRPQIPIIRNHYNRIREIKIPLYRAYDNDNVDW
jgi:hypothetical protein